MPYVHRKVSADRVCVYKKNSDGSAGKRVGCTTPDNLKDYLAAIHIHDREGSSAKSKGGKS